MLESLGSGARFESIARGILDLRDLFYYLSLVGAFLSLNVFVLERQRWAGNAANSAANISVRSALLSSPLVELCHSPQ